ncbi:MAG: hypothetical protein ABIS06_08110 [Vicinamibacterales bacterium]
MSQDNLLWLRGQAVQTGKGSVSELLDRIVTEARTGGWAEAGAVRSVVGTIDIPDDDHDLEGADAYIRTVFATSTRQPTVARERGFPSNKNSKRARRG